MHLHAIEICGVSKQYGERYALRDVHLTIARGQVHGLLGVNGAGKTTLMRVLLGLVRVDAGQVRILGAPLASVGNALPDGIAGFVDTPGFYPYLTGRTNLALLERLDNTRQGAPNVNDALDAVGLTEAADRLVSGYSAGMRQRLGIAAALLRSPEVLLLDEPTTSLDPAAARDVRALVARLAGAGTAVVWSSHDMTEVDQLCDALTIIHGGCVVFSGTIDRLRQRVEPPLHRINTSNNRAAVAIARDFGLSAGVGSDAHIELSADVDTLDGYVIALGCAGIAIRSLTHRARSLETLFLELTGDRMPAIGRDRTDDARLEVAS